MPLYVQRSIHRLSRLWVAEAVLVAAILAFGGFVLMSDAGMTPAQLAAGISQFAPR